MTIYIHRGGVIRENQPYNNMVDEEDGIELGSLERKRRESMSPQPRFIRNCRRSCDHRPPIGWIQFDRAELHSQVQVTKYTNTCILKANTAKKKEGQDTLSQRVVTEIIVISIIKRLILISKKQNLIVVGCSNISGYVTSQRTNQKSQSKSRSGLDWSKKREKTSGPINQVPIDVLVFQKKFDFYWLVKPGPKYPSLSISILPFLCTSYLRSTMMCGVGEGSMQ